MSSNNQDSFLKLAAKHLVRKGVKQVGKKAATSVASAIGWPVILAAGAVVLVIALVLFLFIIVVVVLGSSQTGEAFAYQCQSRLGASPAYAPNRLAVPNSANPSGSVIVRIQPTGLAESTTTRPPTTTVRPTTTPAATSSAHESNPFASLSADPSDPADVRACVDALRSGELIPEPVLTRTTRGAPIARVAQDLAEKNTVVEAGAGNELGPTAGRISNANFIRYALVSTGSVPATTPAAAPASTTTPPAPTATSAPAGRQRTPTTLAELITLGDRVDPSSISAGDIIYYNFTASNGPSAAMIALSPTTGVTADTPGSALRVVTIPTGNIVVKRVAAR